MNKLISNPTECGYRIEDMPSTSEYFKCIHSKNFNGNCDNTNKFPYNCPLQDGISTKNVLALTMAIISEKSKRRNRKDCIYYGGDKHPMFKNERGQLRNVGKCKKYTKGNHPDCRGVDCGDFKTKYTYKQYRIKSFYI